MGTDKRRAKVTQGAMLGSLSKVGVMVYKDLDALNFADVYVKGCQPEKCSQWYCPIKACVPAADVVVGLEGRANSTVVSLAATQVMERGLGGLMVWYASLLDAKTGRPALQYDAGDASDAPR